MSTKNLLLVTLMVFLLACGGSEEQTQPGDAKPNVIFLFADDFTYEAVHALGNDLIQTPNIDKLAAMGTTFTHAYNMGGWHGAICVASRSMIISGASLWRSQTVAESWGNHDSAVLDQTWGRLMQSAGYGTYMSGKWHVQAPVDQVFETVSNLRPGGMPGDYWVNNDTIWRTLSRAYLSGEDLKPYMPMGYDRPAHEDDTSWSAADITHGGYWEGGKHWSEVLKDDALKFIDHATSRQEPFFMYLAFNAPHDPRQAPQTYLDQYPLEDIPLPENWLAEYPYKDSIGNTPLLRDEALAPYPRTPHAIKTHIKEYYAIISHLDAQIGEILEALEAAGVKDNTYIFFTGDHGLAVGHHGLLGKQNLYDHSIRVPLMMTGPDIPGGKLVDHDVYLQDIMATSLELAGIEKPNHVEFNSLMPLALGNSQGSSYPQGIYGAYVDFQRMIRKDGFKLLVYPKIDKIMLFDMKTDPLEMNDLSQLPSQAERIKSLFEDLIELQKEMDDPLDLTGMYQSFRNRAAI